MTADKQQRERDVSHLQPSDHNYLPDLTMIERTPHPPSHHISFLPSRRKQLCHTRNRRPSTTAMAVLTMKTSSPSTSSTTMRTMLLTSTFPMRKYAGYASVPYGQFIEINRRDFGSCREISLTGWTDRELYHGPAWSREPSWAITSPDGAS